MDTNETNKEKSKAFKEEQKEREKLKQELKGQAAISVFQVLIQDYVQDCKKKKHEYKNEDEYRANIKLLADDAWQYADVFMDAYGYAWPKKKDFYQR